MVFLISTDEKAHAVKRYMSKLWVGIYISVVECFGGQYHVNKMVKHEKVLRMSHDCKKMHTQAHYRIAIQVEKRVTASRICN